MILLLALISLAPARGQREHSAIALLKRAERLIYSDKSTKEVQFASTYYDSNGSKTGQTTGRMLIDGERFRLEYGNIIAVFSTGILSYHDSEQETLTISQPTEEELIQINPLHFVRSNGKGFNCQTLPSVKHGEVIGLTPQKKTNGLKQVEVVLKRTNGAPSEITIIGEDDARLIVRIISIEPTSNQPASTFTLEPKQFPNSEVVDLR